MITLGIDFGGTTIKPAVVSNGTIIQRAERIETQAYPSSEAIIEAIVGTIAGLRATHPGITAIGVGLPGLVDSINGIVHELSNVPGWCDVPLRQILADASGLPVLIENDANAMAYAEWKYGAARGKNNVICITLGTGVGGGLILNGQLYRGANLAAGEIGHMHYHPQGPAAGFGNTGALEKLVGNREIVARMLTLFGEVEEATPAHLTELAGEGDIRAIQLWKEIGTEIGVVLSDIVWLLNPDAIVIGGGVAKAGRWVFDPIRQTIAGRTPGVIHQNLDIVPAMLGNDAGVIGSAALAGNIL